MTTKSSAAASERAYASSDDIRVAIETASVADRLRIRSAGRFLSLGTDMEADELGNEAIKRAMEGADGRGGRHWPLDVPFAAFVIESMRSIADASRNSAEAAATDGFHEVDSAVVDTTSPSDFKTYTPGVEDEIERAEDLAERGRAAQTALDAVNELFKDDEDVRWLLLCYEEERHPAKARETAGFTKERYETTRRRMRRGLERLFPMGRTA